MLKRLHPWIERVLGRKLGPKFKFEEYVSHWMQVAKNPRAWDVSPECMNSKEWIDLAQAQYALLKWAGLQKDWTIIEIGCGNGKVPYMLERENAISDGKYFGLDIVEECVEACRTRFRNTTFRFQIIRNNKITFDDEFADCVFLMSVFTHVDESTIRNYLMQIRRILKPSGICIFSVHLARRGETQQVTIPVARYPFERIREIVREAALYSLAFAKYPPHDSERYFPGGSPDRPYGFQFLFVVSKSELSNLELVPI